MSSPPTSSSPPPISNGDLMGLNSSGNFELSNGFVYPPLNNTNNINSSSINSKSGSTFTEGDLLYEETRKGTREASTIIEFMRKRVKIEEEYAKALLQLCKSFPLGSNGTAIGEIFSNLLECTAKQAGSYLTAATQITSEVNTPLKQFIDDLKSELKGVQQEAQKLAAEKREVCESFKRSKATFETSCKEADSDSSKMEELEKEYKAHISHTNTYLQVVHQEKFQKIAMELQKTEVLRIHKMKVSLKRFVSLLEEVPQTAADFAQLSERINVIDTKEEIRNFSALVKSLNRSEEEIVFEPYERVQKHKKEWRITKRTTSLTNLTVGPLGSGNNNGKSTSQEDKKVTPRSPQPPAREPYIREPYIPPPTAVFGVPMEVVMERQRGRYPDLPVPHVIVTLIDLIKHLNGCKTEGIFRVPGVTRETEALKRAFDEGEAVEAKQFPNVHTAASTLKLWLRELPNSIVPEDMYYSCLGCETDSAAFVCVDNFPLLNRRVLLLFLQFFKELLREENVAKTRMDAENISIVFTPSLMRCSSVPQTSLLDNVDKERAFVHRLISSCDILLEKYNLLPPSQKENQPPIGDQTQQENQPPKHNPVQKENETEKEKGKAPRISLPPQRESPLRESGSWKTVRVPSPPTNANPVRPQLSPLTRLASQKFPQQN